jgi:DNA repair photolyase
VQGVFEERLRKAFPDRAERVLHRLRETRDGQLYDTRFGHRMKGTGLYADTIRTLFQATARRLGFDTAPMAEEPPTFRRPEKPGAQLPLF